MRPTQGPWKVGKNGEIRAIQDGIEITIATAYDLRHDSRGIIQDANARLIAAAPELFDAIKAALKGERDTLSCYIADGWAMGSSRILECQERILLYEEAIRKATIS